MDEKRWVHRSPRAAAQRRRPPQGAAIVRGPALAAAGGRSENGAPTATGTATDTGRFRRTTFVAHGAGARAFRDQGACRRRLSEWTPRAVEDEHESVVSRSTRVIETMRSVSKDRGRPARGGPALKRLVKTSAAARRAGRASRAPITSPSGNAMPSGPARVRSLLLLSFGGARARDAVNSRTPRRALHHGRGVSAWGVVHETTATRAGFANDHRLSSGSTYASSASFSCHRTGSGAPSPWDASRCPRGRARLIAKLQLPESREKPLGAAPAVPRRHWQPAREPALQRRVRGSSAEAFEDSHLALPAVPTVAPAPPQAPSSAASPTFFKSIAARICPLPPPGFS